MAITRGDVGLLFGLTGFLMGGVGAFYGIRAMDRHEVVDGILDHDREVLDGLTSRGTESVENIQAANVRMTAMQKQLDIQAHDIQTLTERLAKVEAK